jgi:hypothetical protein
MMCRLKNPNTMCAITSRGSYIFYPKFTAVYIVWQLILQTIYVLNESILQILDLKFAVYNRERFKSRGGYKGAHVKSISVSYSNTVLMRFQKKMYLIVYLGTTEVISTWVGKSFCHLVHLVLSFVSSFMQKICIFPPFHKA